MTSSRRHEQPKARAGTRTLPKGAVLGAAGKPVKGGARKTVTRGQLTRMSKGGKLFSQAIEASSESDAHKPPAKTRQAAWPLQDAKARFSELVRRVKIEGPQQVSVHGKVEVVVMSADEYRRLQGGRTGAALIEALQASPSRDVDLTPVRAPMPVRTIEL